MLLVTLIYIIYGVISLVLYATVLYIVGRLGKSKLCRAFSKLIVLYSIVNILAYINSWYSHRLRPEPIFWPVYNYLNTQDGLRNSFTFLMPLFNYNQSVCNLLLTVNRFTAIKYPIRHSKFWNTYIWPTIFLSMIFGSVSACSRLPIFIVWKYSSVDNAYFIQHIINLNAFWFQIGFCAILLTICTVLNAISIFQLRKLGGSQSIKDTERAFFFVAVCTFLAECANLFMLTGKQISQSSNFTNLWIAFNVGSPYVTDICSLGLPYYLLLVRGPIQKRTFKIFVPTATVLSTGHSDRSRLPVSTNEAAISSHRSRIPR